MGQDSSNGSNTTDHSIAVGAPVFQRTEALKRFLESIDPDFINRVIIADNGHTNNRQHIYNRDWGFERTVIDLEYDIGTGACRSAIAEELREEYLLVVDIDMILPSNSNLSILVEVLESRSNLGAVSGTIIEANRIRSGCTSLHPEPSLSGKQVLVESIREDPPIEWVNNQIPIALFDKLTNASLIRRECIEDYSWDSAFPIGEHLDFYIGHLHRTDWDFAVTPSVTFKHEKEKYNKYRQRIRSDSNHHQNKIRRANNAGKRKWGYDKIVTGRKKEWFDSERKSKYETIFTRLNQISRHKFPQLNYFGEKL